MNNQSFGMGMEVAAQNPQIFAQQNSGNLGVNGVQPNMLPGVQLNVELSPEQTSERQMGPNQGEDQRDAGLENAVGVVTVGASGVTPEEPKAKGIVSANLSSSAEDEGKLDRVPEEAKDDGKMEKSWMKRAQEVVTETRDNPHRRLVQVALLREEYMRKRFNRILGEHN